MTHGELLILRLLSSADYYGYELDRIIDENHMRAWADIGFSSIYALLGRLEKQGYVEARFEKEHGSPRRKVYSITETGRAGARSSTAEMLSAPGEPRDDFTVALVTADLLGEDERRECLDSCRRELERRIELFRGAVPAAVRSKPWVMRAMDRRLRLMQADLAWLNEL